MLFALLFVPGVEVFFGSFQKPLPFFPMLEVIEAAIKAARRPYTARVLWTALIGKKRQSLQTHCGCGVSPGASPLARLNQAVNHYGLPRGITYGIL